MSRVCAGTPADRSRHCARAVYGGNKTQRVITGATGAAQPQQRLQADRWHGLTTKSQHPLVPPGAHPSCEFDLPYSSRMILRTLRTIFPTVVSEGCAAVILLPSLRIKSIRSPETQERPSERGRRAVKVNISFRNRTRTRMSCRTRVVPVVVRDKPAQQPQGPPRFRVSTKPSILSDNSEPFAAAPGISNTVPGLTYRSLNCQSTVSLPGRERSTSAR